MPSFARISKTTEFPPTSPIQHTHSQVLHSSVASTSGITTASCTPAPRIVQDQGVLRLDSIFWTYLEATTSPPSSTSSKNSVTFKAGIKSPPAQNFSPRERIDIHAGQKSLNWPPKSDHYPGLIAQVASKILPTPATSTFALKKQVDTINLTNDKDFHKDFIPQKTLSEEDLQKNTNAHQIS